MEAQERTRGIMREIKVGDEVIIKDVLDIVGNNTKTSDSIEEYLATVVDIRKGIEGSTLYACRLAVLNKVISFPKGVVKFVAPPKSINKGDTVWVYMGAIESENLAENISHTSGYAEVEKCYSLAGIEYYDVRFRGSDNIYHIIACRVFPVQEIRANEDTQEDNRHDKHYREAVVEPILVMQALFSHDEFIGFLKGNILKYRLRAGHKGGEEEMKSDLDKIHVYEEWLERAKKGEHI